MLPVTDVVVAGGLGVGLCGGGALFEGAHATSRTMATPRNARLMEVKPSRAAVIQMFERDCPPSTAMHAPVRRLACCEQTNATTLATSSTAPNRPSGISERTNLSIPSGSACCRRYQPPPSHRIEPGAMQLTVTPCAATSRAREVVKLISAALAAL